MNVIIEIHTFIYLFARILYTVKINLVLKLGTKNYTNKFTRRVK